MHFPWMPCSVCFYFPWYKRCTSILVPKSLLPWPVFPFLPPTLEVWPFQPQVLFWQPPTCWTEPLQSEATPRKQILFCEKDLLECKQLHSALTFSLLFSFSSLTCDSFAAVAASSLDELLDSRSSRCLLVSLRRFVRCRNSRSRSCRFSSCDTCYK